MPQPIRKGVGMNTEQFIEPHWEAEKQAIVLEIMHGRETYSEYWQLMQEFESILRQQIEDERKKDLA